MHVRCNIQRFRQRKKGERGKEGEGEREIEGEGGEMERDRERDRVRESEIDAHMFSLLCCNKQRLCTVYPSFSSSESTAVHQ